MTAARRGHDFSRTVTQRASWHKNSMVRKYVVAWWTNPEQIADLTALRIVQISSCPYSSTTSLLLCYLCLQMCELHGFLWKNTFFRWIPNLTKHPQCDVQNKHWPLNIISLGTSVEGLHIMKCWWPTVFKVLKLAVQKKHLNICFQQISL